MIIHEDFWNFIVCTMCELEHFTVSVYVLINVLMINLDDDDQSGRDHNHNSNTFLNFLPGLVRCEASCHHPDKCL